MSTKYYDPVIMCSEGFGMPRRLLMLQYAISLTDDIRASSTAQ